MSKRAGVTCSFSSSPLSLFSSDSLSSSPSCSPPSSPLSSCSPTLLDVSSRFTSPFFFSSPSFAERIVSLLAFLLYIILKPFVWIAYVNSVSKVHQHWDHSVKVNLKLDEINEKMKEYGIGPGSVFLYSAEGDNLRGLFRFIIKGVTSSRYSHAMMVVPHPKNSDDVAVWQSGISYPIKLGGGDTICGPDVADMKQLISVFNKMYTKSRFVFRPLRAPLSPPQHQQIHQSMNKVMEKPDIYFPINVAKIYWSWVLSNNPTLAHYAHYFGLDCGVKKDDYDFMFCSMLVTRTLVDIGVLDASTKYPQYSPGDYGLPANKVPCYGDEYEFIFDDLETL